jgi:hypothetical protein
LQVAQVSQIPPGRALLGSADNGVGERCSAVTTGMAETTMPESVNVRL